MRINITPRKYVVVDIETTGCNHFKDDIIEIGAIRYDNGNEVGRLSLLLKTSHCLSAAITQLTGITNEMLDKDGVNPEEAIKALCDFCKDDIVMGHNFTTFDSKFLNDAYNKYLNISFENDFVDTLYLAKEIYPDMKNRTLKDLSEMFKIDYSKAHRAVEDCEINHLVYENMVFGNSINTNAKVKNQEFKEELIDVFEEEVSIVNLPGFMKNIYNSLSAINSEFRLPENSFKVSKNYSEKNKEIYYSLYIVEQDVFNSITKGDSKTSIAYFIESENRKKDDKDLKVIIRDEKCYKLIDKPSDCEIYTPKSSEEYFRINKYSDELEPYINKVVRYAVKNYSSRAGSFACCARYEKCSEARKCLHPNLLFSTACAYRKNIENGNIFY